MSFSKKVKKNVLKKCKRYCCICEKYAGTHIELHHIKQKADGGKDTEDNCIPLCFDCHSEVGSYNPHHPKGTKYSEEELKTIRDEFYQKVTKWPRRPDNIPESDLQLLKEFREDYGEILEYCKRKDFLSELIKLDLGDRIEILWDEKWSRKDFFFLTHDLETLKNKILDELNELNTYLSPVFYTYHENSGQLIFKNGTTKKGENLGEILQSKTLKIRKKLSKLLDKLYDYEV